MSYGDKIRDFRTAQKMTQKELADLVGVNCSMIAQIERGTKAISLPLGFALADALQVDIQKFR